MFLQLCLYIQNQSLFQAELFRPKSCFFSTVKPPKPNKNLNSTQIQRLTKLNSLNLSLFVYLLRNFCVWAVKISTARKQKYLSWRVLIVHVCSYKMANWYYYLME